MIEMKLTREPFLMIASGKKTVEVRLNDEKRSKIKVGDKICFTLVDDDKKVCVKVLALHRFDSFLKLFSSSLFPFTGFEGFTPESAAQAMYKYYSEADEKRFGVLGIQIELI